MGAAKRLEPNYNPTRKKTSRRPKFTPNPKIRARGRVRRRLKKIKRSIEYVKFDTRLYRIPFAIIFTIILIFAGGVGTAFTFAYQQDLRRQIYIVREEILTQRAENVATQAIIAPNLTYEELSRIARERLNMGHPDVSQIIRINVPRQSYVVQSEAPARVEPQNMWESALWHIKNWLGA